MREGQDVSRTAALPPMEHDTQLQTLQAPSAPRQRKRRSAWRKLLQAGLLIVLVVAVLLGGSLAWGWFSTPSVDNLSALVHAQDQAHQAPYTPLARVSPLIQKALIVTEDESFYSNFGIDPVGLLRSAWDDLRAGQFAEGGSTITEQLAKVAYLDSNDHSLGLKLQDMALALKIEAQYSKAQILEYYLNLVYFGENAYGIGAAAARYFGLTPAQVDLAQAALLAGLVQAPSQYDPFCHPTAARSRQQQVLDRLLVEGDITTSQAAAARAEVLPFWTPDFQPDSTTLC